MRLVIFAGAVVIGVLMWLALNRTKIGMVIRAGVDDRDMLSATGVRVQLVFLGVFAFGAGLAGFAGVVGGTFQSLQPGEDIKILLASLVVVIVGGMGSIPGAALGALLIGLAEQFGSVYMPTYAVVLTFIIMVLVLACAAAGPVARALTMAVEASSTRRHPARGRADAALRLRACGATRRCGSSASSSLILPAFASDFVLVQIFGWTFILGMIALSLMFLGGYGGMVSLVQMTVAGCAGYMVAIFGTSAVAEISLGWPWWLAVLVAILIATLFGTLSGALSVRTEGIYTIMITLAIASAFFYFTLQNYTIFNGFSGFNAVRMPQVVRRRLARAGPVLLPDAVLGSRSPISRSSTSRARRSALPSRARATTRAAWRRSASMSPPTASPPTLCARVIAAVAGVLLVWHGGQISPGTAGRRSGDRHPHHRRRRRHEPADRPVHRRADLRPPAHLRPRRYWRRSGSTASASSS